MKFFPLTIAVFTLCSAQTMAETPPTRLICQFKSPFGIEANNRYFLEIDLDKKQLRLTSFWNGIASGDAKLFDITVTDEYSVAAWRKNDHGRPSEGITINRLTAEAQLHWLSYGADRDKIWNDELKQLGGFKYEPVKLSGNGLQCKSAARQF